MSFLSPRSVRSTFLPLLFVLHSLFSIGQFNKDSLWNIWYNPSLADTSRLKALDDIIWFHYLNTNPDSTLFWAKKEYEFATAKHLPYFIALSLNAQANAYSGKSDLFSAKQCLIERIKIEKQQKNYRGIAATYSNLGSVYKQQNDLTNALNYLFASLKMFEVLKQNENEALVLENIATIYIEKKDFSNGLKYLHRGLEIKRNIGDSSKMGISYLNLGIAHLMMNRTDTAEKEFLLAENIFQRLNDNINLSVVYNNRGKLHLKEKNYKVAIQLIEQAVTLNRRLKLSIHEAKNLHLLGSVWDSLRNCEKAIYYNKLALQIAENKNILDIKQNAGLLLSKCLASSGNFEEALTYYKIAEQARQTLNEASVKRMISIEQIKHNFWEKEFRLKTESEKQMLQLKNQIAFEKEKKSRMIYVTSSVVIILLLTLVFIYFYFKQKQIISSQQNNILSQKFLVSQMNPHFIFNSLNAAQNYILKHNSIEASEFLSDFAALMRQILENSRKDSIPLSAEFTLLNNYLTLQQIRFNQSFTFQLHIDDDIDPDSTLIPPMLAQPFIENAIEHGIFHKPSGGHIDVRIKPREDYLVYEIEDNGVGLETAIKLKKELNTNYQSLATSISKERILFLSKKFNKKFGIEILDKAQINRETTGVKVIFTIPFMRS
ncbi:MAG: tetratricopeptide repeat protein [Sediminibacterium sp.]|nr:tetratricopeptide repeat protein [Sediminibacterium sp.]